MLCPYSCSLSSANYSSPPVLTARYVTETQPLEVRFPAFFSPPYLTSLISQLHCTVLSASHIRPSRECGYPYSYSDALPLRTIATIVSGDKLVLSQHVGGKGETHREAGRKVWVWAEGGGRYGRRSPSITPQKTSAKAVISSPARLAVEAGLLSRWYQPPLGPTAVNLGTPVEFGDIGLWIMRTRCSNHERLNYGGVKLGR